MYYYGYYLLAKFSEKYNNRDGDYAFTGVLLIWLFTSLNLVSILLFFSDVYYFRSHIGLAIGVSAGIPAVIHFLALVHEKKYLGVIEKYDKIYKGVPLNKFHIGIMIVYIIATLLIVIYTANVVRAEILKQWSIEFTVQ